jgi:hypothetical protein
MGENDVGAHLVFRLPLAKVGTDFPAQPLPF